jgi:hypothetical protein
MRKDREKEKEEREKQKRGEGILELCRTPSLAVGLDGPIDDDGDIPTSRSCPPL